MKYKKRRGDFLTGMIIATVLFAIILRGLFELQHETMDSIEQKYVVEELALVAKGVDSYLRTNRTKLMNLAAFQRADNEEYHAFLANDNTSVMNDISEHLPGGTSLSGTKNIWGDTYNVVFIRSKNPASTDDNEREDQLSAYVLASGGRYKKYAEGTTRGDAWLSTGVRRAVMRGGASFGYVTTPKSKDSEGKDVVGTQVLKSGGWETDIGLSKIGAHDGDIGYLVTFNVEDMSSQALMRYPTGDDEDNTMHADIDMNDNNILNIKYLETQAIDTGSIRFDPTLYDSAQEAEASCQQNWLYIKDKETKDKTTAEGLALRRFVDSSGRVYGSWTQNSSGVYSGVEDTFIGTLGMNGGGISSRLQLNGVASATINNAGRIYYIAPVIAETPGNLVHYDKISGGSTYSRKGSNEIFAKKTQLAVCRRIGTKNTLAYIGDNRVEDKISFIVSAVDGDFIPPFYCPGQDANVVGGGASELTYNVPHVNSSGAIETSQTSSETLFSSGRNTANALNNQGIMPRLYVMPQVITTGKKAFPIQGIKAWAETVDTSGSIAKGWIIRLNALIDIQRGAVNRRTYWVGNIPYDKQIKHSFSITSSGTHSEGYIPATDSSPGYIDNKKLEELVSGSSATTSIDYLRAVVIGVCSGKVSTF